MSVLQKKLVWKSIEALHEEALEFAPQASTIAVDARALASCNTALQGLITCSKEACKNEHCKPRRLLRWESNQAPTWEAKLVILRYTPIDVSRFAKKLISLEVDRAGKWQNPSMKW